MVTAAPELSVRRTWPGAVLWTLAGAWAFESLPPDGSAGLWLGGVWALLLVWRWLPGQRPGGGLARLAGLCCPAPQPRLSDVAMGWMMGTLWWHAEGCLSAGWPAAATVAGHLGLMLGLGHLAGRLPPGWQRRCALGAWALMASSPLWTPALPNPLWPCMLLLTLAWACEPAGTLPGRLSWQRAVLGLCGPLGLWLILARWPLHGAEALLQPLAQLALAAALVCVFHQAWRLVRLRHSGGPA